MLFALLLYIISYTKREFTKLCFTKYMFTKSQFTKMEKLTQKDLKRIQTNDAIIDASITIFGNYDFHAAKYSDISKIANVTNGLIVQRFNSKEHLYSMIFKEVLIKNFPKFNDNQSIDECLTDIINYIKPIEKRKLLFISKVINSLHSAPFECTMALDDVFFDTRLETVFTQKMIEVGAKEQTPFDIFVLFLKSTIDTTLRATKDESPVAYIQMFKKWFDVNIAKLDLSRDVLFEEAFDNVYKSFGIFSWYVEFNDQNEPKLFMQQRALDAMGLKDTDTPEEVYKAFNKGVAVEDRSNIKNAIYKMMLGERVEFSFNWNTKYRRSIRLRCFGAKSNANGVTRFDGTLQTLDKFVQYKSKHENASILMEAIAKDNDYVGYLNFGNTIDDDYLEDFKATDFIKLATNNWFNMKNFNDRIQQSLIKLIEPSDQDHFRETVNRDVVYANLQNSNIYSQPFKIQYLGAHYLYQISFIADKDDNQNLVGAVCAIRFLESKNKVQFEKDNKIVDTNSDENAFNSLFTNYLESAYLIDLTSGSFTVYRASKNASNVSMGPDFSLFCTQYINLYLHFDDKERMIKETSLERIRERLAQCNAYGINYRESSSGTIQHYKMRVIKAGPSSAAIGFMSIENEYAEETHENNQLQRNIRELTHHLKKERSSLNSLYTNTINTLLYISESKNRYYGDKSRNIKTFTLILAKQVMQDYPEYRLNDTRVNAIASASALHDIGKMFLPDSILYTDSRLTEEQYEEFKKHTIYAEKIIEKFTGFWTKDYTKLVTNICLYHHERYDGKGYPFHKVGEDIPLEAQITSITDSFDSLMSKRINPFECITASQMIINGECGSFNPKLIESFKKCYTDMIKETVSGIDPDSRDEETAERILEHGSQVVNDEALSLISRLGDQMPGGLIIHKQNDEGTLLYFNNYMVNLCDCNDREDFLDQCNNSVKGLVHPDDYQVAFTTAQRQISESNTDGYHITYRIQIKDQQTKYIEAYGQQVHSDKYGDIVYAFLLDITDSAKAMISQKSPAKTQLNLENSDLNDILGGVRIMLIDQNDYARINIKATLENAGAYVTEVNSSEEAIELIKTVKPYDLILLNPFNADGYKNEIIEDLRDFGKVKDFKSPIVAYYNAQTCNLDEDDAQDFDFVLEEPITVGKITRLLIQTTKERAAHMEDTLQRTIQYSNIDTLTHVKNASAYKEVAKSLSKKIKSGRKVKFAVVFADINKLKTENDTYGHGVGDIYIRNCSKLICDCYIHSPVFRVGGDEFVIILEGEDYEKRDELFDIIESKIEVTKRIDTSQHGKASLAIGMATYDPDKDTSFEEVLKRADAMMYENKEKSR